MVCSLRWLPSRRAIRIEKKNNNKNMKLKETINLITEAGLANWDEKCPPGGGVIPYNRLMGMCSQMGSHFHSLRSKRFQLSHCAKVRAGAFLFFFFSSRSSRRTRAETLATQASIFTTGLTVMGSHFQYSYLNGVAQFQIF